MEKKSKIFVTGHRGLVGSAMVRYLKAQGYIDVVTVNREGCDLRNSDDVDKYFRYVRPEYVFCAAGRVGGIFYNDTYPADFLYDNGMIALNVLRSCKDYGVRKVLYLGSSCIYPRGAQQPMPEEILFSGKLEPTNIGYSMAKLCGVELCILLRKQYNVDAISVLPTNLYGQNDNYDLNNSHVIPGMIRRIHEAKVRKDPVVELWGTGRPRREFMYVDDLADACLFLMLHYSDGEPINAGSGIEVTISELARTVADVVEYKGEIRFDTNKLDGMMRKLLDSSKIRELGWEAKVKLRDGIRAAYADFVAGGGRNSGIEKEEKTYVEY